MQIVLVEDDEIILKSLSYFLTASGHEVLCFANGMDAMDHIKEHHRNIRLLITDLNLPFAGGKQVIHTARQLQGVYIPIIVLTSSGVEATELEVLELGADDFVSKPFSPAVLLKRIEKLIAKHG